MSAPKCRSGVCGKLRGAFVASPVRYAVCQANAARLRASSVRRFTAELFRSQSSAGVRS